MYRCDVWKSQKPTEHAARRQQREKDPFDRVRGVSRRRLTYSAIFKVDFNHSSTQVKQQAQKIEHVDRSET